MGDFAVILPEKILLFFGYRKRPAEIAGTDRVVAWLGLLFGWISEEIGCDIYRYLIVASLLCQGGKWKEIKSGKKKIF